ncbi:MAG: sugar kinase [Deltaproteobacteria bacterium]|nr:sugar kinase [Deltaproteobacteria bacterium]
MSWLIVGTVPIEGFPLLDDHCSLEGGSLRVGSTAISINRGTPALIAFACETARSVGIAPPRALLAGDIGKGDGSEKVYRHLCETLPNRREDLIVFHYLMPDVYWLHQIMNKLDDLSHRPRLVADAGFMYVAKMGGSAPAFDLFTPDLGEMAFLADESAPHPFYTRGFLLDESRNVPELVKLAYENENAARYLLVKGRVDYVASKDKILSEISEPNIEAMESIGGTGDSLTGIVAALIAAGMQIPEAATLAARANRLMGALASPNPAWSIADFLPFVPSSIRQVKNSS